MTVTAPGKARLHFAVVGAGVAGLACARQLVAGGMRATVFEAGAAVGGRLASVLWEGASYDVGAQFLMARSAKFALQLEQWEAGGVVQRWNPDLVEFDRGLGNAVHSDTPCYVGVPSMQSIAVHLAQGSDVVFNAPVGRVVQGSAEWYLFDAQERPLGIAGFDGLVLALPSVVARGLLGGVPELAALLEPVRWDACWTAGVSLSRPSGIEFDVAFIRDDPILAWAARECSKPRRRKGPESAERWLLQARPTWSNNFGHLAPDDAARWMQRAFAARLARPMAQKSTMAMRWAHATPAAPLSQSFLWDSVRKLGLAGDWCGGASVEAAFLSGCGVAGAIAAD